MLYVPTDTNHLRKAETVTKDEKRLIRREWINYVLHEQRNCKLSNKLQIIKFDVRGIEHLYYGKQLNIYHHRKG